MEEVQNVKKVSKKVLWKVFWGSMTIRCANNFERQQNAGFTQAMSPVVESLYDTDEEKKEAYERHLELFLTQDMVSAIPIGISCAMEEENANSEEFDPEAINAVKTAMMGPLAGLGDSLINGTARPILAGLACSLATAGTGWAGPIMFVLSMSLIAFGTRYLGVFKGYEEGTKLVVKMQQSGIIDKISELASIAAYVIVGGFIPAIVVMNIPIEYSAGETTISIQETFDGLAKGLLPLLYTLLMYYLLTKKKMSAVTLMFFTMIFGILAVYLGILG